MVMELWLMLGRSLHPEAAASPFWITILRATASSLSQRLSPHCLASKQAGSWTCRPSVGINSRYSEGGGLASMSRWRVLSVMWNTKTPCWLLKTKMQSWPSKTKATC